MYHTNFILKSLFKFNPFTDADSRRGTLRQYFIFLLAIFYCSLSLTAQHSFFVSSNNQQSVGVFDMTEEGTITEKIFRNISPDTDGIYYDESTDMLYQLNRNNGAVAAYNNVKSSLENYSNPPLSFMSAAETINGRAMTVSENRLVIAQDANEANGNQNRLIVLDISPTDITLVARYEVDFDLWGIHADGETLYAVEDNSNRLAVFNDFFFLPEGKINPTQVISIEGITRTHGVTYVADRDMMLLTDVGAAGNPDDGAISVVMNYKAAAMDGNITAEEQFRIEGDKTFLGDPADIDFDAARSMIYVAERVNGGGRILSFTIPSADGNFAPNYNYEFTGASAIHFPRNENFQESMETRLAQLFVSSNTQQNFGVYNIWNDKKIVSDRFNHFTYNADGIYYDRATDVLYQLNRMNNSIATYSNVNASIQQGFGPVLRTQSSAEFSNGRKIAISGNKMVVAQDGNDANGNINQFVLFNFSPEGFTFIDRFKVDFNLWGIHADGNRLYAVVNNSNQIGIFDNFFTQPAVAAKRPFFITVEGISRAHGMTYVAESDMMLLTDIGAKNSSDDGAFIIIKNFKTASADGTVSLSEQIKVSGDATFLGNPVDIAFEPGEMMIYIAERANGGGRVLGFAMPTMSGNYMPTYNDFYGGASAVYLSSDTGMGGPKPPTPAVADRFFVSSNTQRVIATYNLQEDDNIIKQQFANANTDADGIYYDENSDILYQVNRTGSAVNAYVAAGATLDQGLMPLVSYSSAAEFSNGRGLAVNDDWLVVAQDANEENNNQNRLFIFDKHSLSLKRKIDVNFNLWGIHAEGSTLYAVEDNSNRLVIYEDFFNQLDSDTPMSFEVSIDGLVRTHGITYDASRDLMLLTDVGAASSSDDGAFVTIDNFREASLDGVVSAEEQIRIEGNATFLGNPVDIAFDGQRSIVYIAERANGGGRVLGFSLPTTSGNIAPVYNDLHAGASAIYFADGAKNHLATAEAIERIDTKPMVDNQPNPMTFEVYPNPASNYLTVDLPELDFSDTAERLIIIYDTFGKEVLQMDTNNLQRNIDISGLTDGVYYIVVTQNGRLATKQFIKTNHF